MTDPFIPALVVLLQVSVFLQILFIAAYLKSKSRVSFAGFLFTTFTSFSITALMLVMYIQNPRIIYIFQLEEILFVESGLLFTFLLFIKIRIALKIAVRSKDPDYYDLNFFGKKVYKTKIISKGEVAAFILSTPVTMFAGAYFFVRLLF